MTYSVTIKEKTKVEKGILTMLKLLAEKYDGVSVIKEVKNNRLVKLVRASSKSGLANTNQVMKKMGLT